MIFITFMPNQSKIHPWIRAVSRPTYSRGTTKSWRHAPMSSFAAKTQPLEQLHLSDQQMRRDDGGEGHPDP